MTPFDMKYRILYGNCVSVSDVLQMLDKLSLANNLDPQVKWVEAPGAKPVLMTRQQMITHILTVMKESLKPYENKNKDEE